MQILFQSTPAVVKERQTYVQGEIVLLIPNTTVSFSPDGSEFMVTLPQGTDTVGAVDAIVWRMSALGYRAEQKGMKGDYVPLYEEHFFGKAARPARTVRLRTFIISLVATVLICTVLCVSLAGSLANAMLNQNPLGTIEGTGENYFDQINLLDQIFDTYSLYDINGNLLIDEMLHAYAAASGDRYAEYYTHEELVQMLEASSSKAVGMGVSIQISEEPYGFLVIDVYDGTPAASAGLLPGDVIVAVGEEKALVKDIGYSAAQAKLVGTAGSTVHFRASRGGELHDFSIACAEFVAQTVRYRQSATDPSVGIVSIRAFHTDTPVAFYAAMEALINAGCDKFVFDVRDNPGGDVKSVFAVLSTFLQNGDLVYSTVTKGGDVEEYYLAPVEYENDTYKDCSIKEEMIGKYRDYKKVILTDGGSASAAELFTAVLLDYGLATTVGTKTFGKGILQSVIFLEKWGYHGAVKLTTGYYNPPKSGNYHDVGLTPTLTVDPAASLSGKHVWLWSESEDNQLATAITELTK